MNPCRRWKNCRCLRDHASVAADLLMDWPRIGAAVPPLVFCHGMTIRTPRGCISLDSGIRTREVYHQPKSGLRPARRHGFHARFPWRSNAPFGAEWLFSLSCFGWGREGSSGRISRAVGTVLRRQDKSGSPVAIQAPDRACLSPCRPVGA